MRITYPFYRYGKWRYRLWQVIRCPRRTLDGHQCRFSRWHEGQCEIGGQMWMPYPLKDWNDVLWQRMQRGFEAELEEWRSQC